MAYLCKMFKIYVRENVSNVKEEKDQTTMPCHDSSSVSSVFETKRRKFMAYCGVGPLFAAKFKKFKWLKPHKSVNNNKKLKITPIYSSNIPSFNVCFSKYCRLCCRFPCSFNCCSLQDVFSSRVCLEIVRLITLVVVVSTVKRLLTITSARLHVSF